MPKGSRNSSAESPQGSSVFVAALVPSWRPLVLVVVADVDLSGSSVRPAKDHPPLVVDPDAVQASETAFQGLQPVTWRRPQVAQHVGVVEHVELPCGDFRHSRPASVPWRPPVDEEPLYLTIGKALNRHNPSHTYLYTVYLFTVIDNDCLAYPRGLEGRPAGRAAARRRPPPLGSPAPGYCQVDFVVDRERQRLFLGSRLLSRPGTSRAWFRGRCVRHR